MAITVMIIMWLLSGINQKNIASNQQQNNVDVSTDISVRVRDQIAKNVIRNLKLNGRTAPSRIVNIKAETDGRVIGIGANRGERISNGSLLVQLSERDRFAKLAKSTAMLNQRKAEFNSQKKLNDENFISEVKLQESIANLEHARHELTLANLDIEFMNIKSPFEGSLQERNVEIGDYVKSGDTIATIIDDNELIVKAEISEHDVKYIKIGDLGLAELATGQKVQGIIRYIAPAANESTRTFDIELLLNNKDGLLRAGVSSELTIPAEELPAHLVSPALLSLNDEGIIGLKILTDENIVKFVSADIVLNSNDGVYLAGLPYISTIITVGQGYVKTGMRVNPVTETDTNIILSAQSEKQGQ
tara:strand:+ start:16275 stop:17354 length:1080 start_codon:yes stop_codon:yes gene_type:complete